MPKPIQLSYIFPQTLVRSFTTYSWFKHIAANFSKNFRIICFEYTVCIYLVLKHTDLKLEHLSSSIVGELSFFGRASFRF